MKTIGVEITPDRHNLIGTSCLKNFLIENVAFADPKFAGEEAPYTKKYPRVRRALGHVFCDSCLGLTSAVLQCTLVVFNFSSGKPRKCKENRGEVRMCKL